MPDPRNLPAFGATDAAGPSGLRQISSAVQISSAIGLRICLALAVVSITLATPSALVAQEWSFIRADANGDGDIDISDAVATLVYLFLPGTLAPACLDALDMNDDGAVDLADPIRIVSYLFSAGDPPEAPFPGCGPDITDDLLDCAGPLSSCPAFVPPIATFQLSDEAAEDGVGIFLVPQPAPTNPAEFSGRQLGMRFLDLDFPPVITSGVLRLETLEPGLSFYLLDGTPLPTPYDFDITGLPVTVLVNADVPVDTQIIVRSLVSGATDELRVRGGPFPGLAGQSLPEFPHFQFIDAIDGDALGAAVEVAIDPERYADRLGQSFDIHIVPHRTLDEWAADSSLSDVTTAVETVTLTGTGILDMIIPVWIAGLDSGPEVSLAYDVVLDFGQDGFLNPGDVIEGLGGDPAFSVVKSLVTPGPHPFTSVTYSGGSFLSQKTYYPTNLATIGPLPLVVISHGNGHNYTWYDYLGNHLASHGYVVMSHTNNTMPGIETSATTTLTNTEYFLANNATLAGGVFAGLIDVHRIAWIGHSRGGEGVCRAYDRIADGVYNPINFAADDIQVISSIAPTVFLGPTNSSAHDRNYHLLAGGADGDVTGGADCSICQYLRLTQSVTGSVQVTYIHGAAHNDFNCCGFADGTGPSLIGRTAAQNIAKGYFLALVERYLKDNQATVDYFRRSPLDLLPATTLAPYTIATQYEPPQGPDRMAIDDFQEVPAQLAESSGGWPVTYDVTNVHEDFLRETNGSFAWTTGDPRNGMTQAGTAGGDTERGVVFDWPNDGSSRSYQWEIPEGERNWLPWTSLSLRACQGTRHPNTNSLNNRLDFTVTLEDGSGNTASIPIGVYMTLTKPYPRTGLGSGAGWANEFNSVQMRLADFQVEGTGLRLDDIHFLRFEFGAGFGSLLGRIGIDDVLLVR